MSQGRKRIIVCLDGTWVNSDKGYVRPTLSQPNASLQVPSNVSRLYRALKRRDRDGRLQVMYYHSGVGSGSFTDAIAGGAFGAGLSENIREAYDFITTNYESGDEIIIVGFSRGAFTARSLAGLITEIGLLNSTGMQSFYPIFKDIENAQNPQYKDQFRSMPFSHKPRPPFQTKVYRRRLEEGGFTRIYDADGSSIKVRCVAVWDTVGSLGIPDTNIGVRKGYQLLITYRFYDTSLSNGIEYAFQALALDETRTSFAPAVWEKPHHVLTDLRQVWFLGSHANVGGGWPDQELANVSMAWMMDQLASIGVAFDDGTIDHIFQDNVRYYLDHPNASQSTLNPFKRRPWTQWAVSDIYKEHRPVRPWALGKIYESETGFYHLAGKTTRTPGMYHHVDPQKAVSTARFLSNTNERIHRSVRIRLELEGLGFDDVGLYKCPALFKEGPWRLKRMSIESLNILLHRQGQSPYGNSGKASGEEDGSCWTWKYVGPKHGAPPVTVMVEEAIGPYESRLLSLNKGK
ncbi:hypothetical protein AOCH_000310 [Aspergillus ochraceoroseus]|uniref:T6SS Phospholipase effector Tle1-like catalytic domain-containing protein n=1 Tax=Aspergillus ochraceoroseus TaxID=138278 RepID=A0A0F8V7E7_9EURO|nr:hypothetical protein AOCH_000310 [Aspergillus ochraceoroseus]